MKPPAQGIEAIAVKRAKIADADKVRYRVYRAADDYVAVIAESALMAMKISGIMEPYRIMRDLPTEGVAIEAKRMAQVDKVEKVALRIKPEEPEEKNDLVAELEDKTVPLDSRFEAISLKDMQRKKVAWARILKPDEIVHADIVRHGEPAAPAAEVEVPPALEPEPMPEPEPVMEAAPAVEEPAEAPAPSDELSPDEVQQLLNS
jgi:hypothetical protein